MDDIVSSWIPNTNTSTAPTRRAGRSTGTSSRRPLVNGPAPEARPAWVVQLRETDPAPEQAYQVLVDGVDGTILHRINRVLYAMEADGSNLRRLTDGPFHDFHWHFYQAFHEVFQ